MPCKESIINCFRSLNLKINVKQKIGKGKTYSKYSHKLMEDACRQQTWKFVSLPVQVVSDLGRNDIAYPVDFFYEIPAFRPRIHFHVRNKTDLVNCINIQIRNVQNFSHIKMPVFTETYMYLHLMEPFLLEYELWLQLGKRSNIRSCYTCCNANGVFTLFRATRRGNCLQVFRKKNLKTEETSNRICIS